MKLEAPVLISPSWYTKALALPLLRLAGAFLSIGLGFVVAQLILNTLRALLLVSEPAALNLAAFVLFVPLTYGAYQLYARAVEQRAPSELVVRDAEAELGAGLVIGLGLFTATIATLWLLGTYRVSGMNGWLVLLGAFAGAAASGFVQELVFRGVLFRIVESSIGSWWALGLSALLFGLVHLVSPAASPLSTLAAVGAGALFAGGYMLTRRLWLAVGMHVAWDFANDGVFGVAVSGTSGHALPGLLRAELHGPVALTGGAFGVEASAVAIAIVLLASLALTSAAYRRGRIIQPFWKRA